MDQHRAAIRRLEQAGQVAREMGLNPLRLAPALGGLGVIAAGATAVYLGEACEILKRYGMQPEVLSILEVHATHPFPALEAQALLRHCGNVLVLEELEPQLEKELLETAYRLNFTGHITGKLDGSLSRIGDYGLRQVVAGLAKALEIEIPAEALAGEHAADGLAAARPITVCAGCPHRGTYLAINKAIKKLGYKSDQVVVTGDIGCTILGMNAPFDTVWTEVSMGASVSLAQGYLRAGVKTPVIATIGDSTFFHGGIPGLINAVQHQADLTLIIMDNLWTAMTGMQTNPGTPCDFQGGAFRQVDIARIIPALGVEQFLIMDPFDLDVSAATIQQAMRLPGVKVVLSRRECAIQSARRGREAGRLRVVAENCNLCKLCIMVTGCSALSLGSASVTVDEGLCRLCGLCVEVCNREALALDLPEKLEAQA
jgi:indolepyruvate ferredoxin oxidoreductase alpha subunit